MHLLGYWHVTALGLLAVIMHTVLEVKLFLFIYAAWVLALYMLGRLPLAPFALSFLLFFFFLFFLPYAFQTEMPVLQAQQTVHKGRIISDVNMTPTAVSFSFQHEQTSHISRIYYFPHDKLKQDWPDDIQYGASCQLRGKEELPEPASNPGQFDFRKYLKQQGIVSQIILNAPDDLICSGGAPLGKLYKFRNKLLTLSENDLEPETSGWLQALVLGSDAGMDKETIRLFQRWGLSHLLAISGLHIGIIASLLHLFMVKTGLLTKEHAEWAIVLFLPLYAVVAGGAPSVWRASLMAFLAILLKKAGIRLAGSDVISLVFLLFVLLNPRAVFHIGFQMSFCVAFGLILSQGWISQAESASVRLFRISFVAQLMILPLQLAYFFQIQPLSILLNLLVVPYFSVVVIPSMFLLLVVLAVFPGASVISLFEKLFVGTQTILLDVLLWFDSHFNTPLVTGKLEGAAALLYVLSFITGMLYLEKAKKGKAFAASVIMVGVLAGSALKPFLSPEGRVVMLDIGQGDAFVIELPYRQGVVFIDAGAKFSFEDMKAKDSIFALVLEPYLLSRGIYQIDAVFISHEDLDHDGSLPFLLQYMKVKEIIASPLYVPSEQIRKAVKESGVQVEILEAGQAKTIAGLPFYALGPLEQTKSANENSLVLYADIGKKSWLFTGDIGKETEKRLLETYPDLKADVLKVGHHGSKHSSDEAFIDAVAPEAALISAGRKNRYGHPSSDVIDLLESRGIHIFRTDLSGAVTYRFRQGKSGTFYKYYP